MLGISTCLGNSRPQVVFDVETVIWKTLFSLASGTMDPLDLLHQLSNDLPWDDIKAASAIDSAWFDLGKFVLSLKRNHDKSFLSYTSYGFT
jgi:hypothetical protein